MTAELLVVLDTNVLVSALLRPRSLPRQALDAANERGTILGSTESLAELAAVLTRPKFQRYVTDAQRLEFLAALISASKIIEVTTFPKICRDPDDDKFLALASAGQATHLVSGDADLLTLASYQKTRILSPAEFVAEWQ